MKAKRSKVQRVALNARALLTIGIDDPVWKRGKALHLTSDACLGAIIRIRPPAMATDQMIADVEKVVRKQGAAKVRTEERAQADVLPEEDEPTIEAHANQRDVVMQMAEKSKRKKRLKKILDEYMTRAAL